MSFFDILITTAVVVAGVTILLMVIGAVARKSMRDGAREWMRANGFTEHSIVFSPGDALGIDYGRSRIAVQTSSQRKIIPFTDLISVEISEDGATVTKSNRGSQLAGAAIGAIAFGGIGAIVGGLSGSSTSTQKVSKITINLMTKDTSLPFVEIVAFHEQAIDKGGFIYTQLTKDIMPWYGRLRAVLEIS
ncbi:hypothetical protein KYK30_31755 [Shinella yambaruensis]|uniref:Uncharacterized protein n=1 Tax=Shinella yambaruensis TaxID=415996 RepID=A0ABQ5ZTR0_9HYPH|nr:hypothetical protein [Shinella yambaruensis]MCJ8030009.1 hypothetical protein [Shinella yambaruensis]MCU7984301.1 hypothetical protein [Shinella yambaruensis]GLR55129.1 hypothetical protein GCM10007923_63500 [Shinella yambaruensis]